MNNLDSRFFALGLRHLQRTAFKVLVVELALTFEGTAPFADVDNC